MKNCNDTVSFWNSQGSTPVNGWVRIVVFLMDCDLDLSRIINLSRELRFLPFLMTANGHNLEPVKQSEAEIYTKYLSTKKFSSTIHNAIAEAITKDENLSTVKFLLRSIHEGYYKELPQLMLEFFYTCRKIFKKRARDDEDLTEDEEAPLLEPNKRFKNCKNCNETGHTRPTCTKDCNCGIAPVHQGCSCPSLKKNKHTDNVI
jgi:hypothetical protein